MNQPRFLLSLVMKYWMRHFWDNGHFESKSFWDRDFNDLAIDPGGIG